MAKRTDTNPFGAPNRMEFTQEIFNELLTLAKRDMRIGQSFEVIRDRAGGDLFNIENKKLLKLLKDLNGL